MKTGHCLAGIAVACAVGVWVAARMIGEGTHSPSSRAQASTAVTSGVPIASSPDRRSVVKPAAKKEGVREVAQTAPSLEEPAGGPREAIAPRTAGSAPEKPIGKDPAAPDPAPAHKTDVEELERRYAKALQDQDLIQYVALLKQIVQEGDFSIYQRIKDNEAYWELEVKLAQVPGYDLAIAQALASLPKEKVAPFATFLLKLEWADPNQYVWKLRLFDPRQGFVDPEEARKCIREGYEAHAANVSRNGLFLDRLAVWYRDEDAARRILDDLRSGKREFSDHGATLATYITEPAYKADISQQCLARAGTFRVASEGKSLGRILGRLADPEKEAAARELLWTVAGRPAAEREGVRKMLQAMGFDAYAASIPD